MSKPREFKLIPKITETSQVLKTKTTFEAFHEYDDFISFPLEMTVVERSALEAAENRIEELEARCAKLVEELKHSSRSVWDLNARCEKYREALEEARQDQGSTIADLKRIKHSGLVQGKLYLVVQQCIERLFLRQKEVMNTLEALAEGGEGDE